MRPLVDKYLAYTTIPSLNYYLIVEPETVYVTLFSKDAEGKWEARTYVKKEDVISLPQLEIQSSVTLKYSLFLQASE